MTSWWRRRPLHLTDEDLSGYLDNEASTREVDRIRAHLDACEDCRARLDGLRAVQSMLSELPRAVAPRSFVLSPEQAGVQTRSRAPAYVAPPPPPRFRIPSFAPAVALTFFLAVLAVDLAGSSVSQQEDSAAGGAAMSAPVRSSYSADDATKQGETTLVVPQANVPSVAESAARPPSTGPVAPVAPVVPSTTDSAAGAAPETTRAASIPPPATGSGFGGATQSATAMPSAAQASVPPISSPADTFNSTDLANANTDAASQIGIEPAQGGDADGRQSGARDDSGGLDDITVLEIALFVLFLGSLAAVVWPRLFSKGVR